MDSLLVARLVLVALALLGAIVLAWRFDAARRALRSFFFDPTLPVNLGLLRVITFFSLFDDAHWLGPELYAALPTRYLSPTQGWSWLGELLPVSAVGVSWARRALLVAAALAAAGLLTRVTTIVAALLAVYVLGIPNFYFQIGHGSHVQTLAALVLAVSPAGDSLSVDALIRRARGQLPPPAAAAYTVPVRFCWLLVGTMYLFPGLWKAWEAGDMWVTGAKLEIELLKKWGTMPDFYPSFRLDQQPVLLAIFGTLTLVFEIGFFFALFNRVTRILAGLAACCFHLGIWLNMHIWFSPFFPLIVLLEWPQIVPQRFADRCSAIARSVGERVRRAVPALVSFVKPGVNQAPAASLGGSFVVGSLLVFGMFVAGFSPIDSWPIGVYPRFSNRLPRPPASAFALRYKLRLPNGVERELSSPIGDMGEAVTHRIARELLRPARRGRRSNKAMEYVALMAHLVRSGGEVIPPGSQLLIYRYDFATDPDRRRQEKPELKLVEQTEL